jgi:hypothetical protein
VSFLLAERVHVDAVKIRRWPGGMPLRSIASRNGPFGLCQAESFRNSFLARIIHERFCCNRRSTATTSLRPAGSPLEPSTYCTSTHRVLTAPRAGLATRLSDFATNRHEQCGLDSVSFRLPSWQSLEGHPVPPANYAPEHTTRQRSLPTRKEYKGDRLVSGLSPFYFFFGRVTLAEAPAGKRSDFIGETGTQRDCAEKESWN